MSEEILNRVENGVAVITLNRPDRFNALTREMLSDLGAILSVHAEDPDIGCVVLTGAGKAFCSGGDVRVQAQAAAGGGTGSPEQRADQLRRTMIASQLLHDMPKPTIAMVNGVAAGAGMSLALACDLRVVGESGRLTTAFVKVGLSGDYGGTYFLTQLVGSAKAREMYYLSDRVSADEALRLGLTNWVCAPEDLMTKAHEIALRLANGPTVAYRYMKENLNRAMAGEVDDCLDLEATHHVHCGQTEDHREATQAFVAKREPVFKGR